MDRARQTVREPIVIGAPAPLERFTRKEYGDNPPRRRRAVAMQVHLRAATAGRRAPEIADGLRTVETIGNVAADQRPQHLRRRERHAGDGFEKLRGAAVLDDASVAREQECRVAAAGDEDEERRAEGR